MVLAEKGVEYERVHVDLMAGAQRKPEYLEINPHGRVPTLEFDGARIYESTAICEFLDEVHPQPPLLPSGPVQRARARMVEETIDGAMFDAARTIVLNTFAKPEPERDPAAAEEARKRVLWYYEWLDRELEGWEYLAGSFSLADIGAFCGVEFTRFLSVEVKPDLARLRAWHERIKARPSAAALDS